MKLKEIYNVKFRFINRNKEVIYAERQVEVDVDVRQSKLAGSIAANIIKGEYRNLDCTIITSYFVKIKGS